MKADVTLLVAEDDPGHAALVERNLRRAEIKNRILRFQDGQEVLDFLFQPTVAQVAPAFLLVLDIRMPKVDGIEVLRRIKADPRLRSMPVVMLTTTDDPEAIDCCYRLGCSSYVVKPIQAERFAQTVNRLGQFLSVVEVPTLPAE